VSEIRRQVNFALSQNKHADAIKLLQQIAQHDKDQAQQADAIFWLSQTDHVADLPTFLVGLLSATDKSEIKEKAIFSLSQINNAESNQALTNLAKDHKDVAVREKALFWLAQNSPEQAQKAALNILDLGGKDSELENAVFVLSQLPSQQSSAALFAIVKGDYPRNIKKKAIFWLTQSDDEAVLTQLEQWL
jgi:HEAT repeat protein